MFENSILLETILKVTIATNLGSCKIARNDSLAPWRTHNLLIAVPDALPLILIPDALPVIRKARSCLASVHLESTLDWSKQQQWYTSINTRLDKLSVVRLLEQRLTDDQS